MSKTIIITGGARGIGKSCAEAFLAQGWKVGILGRTATSVEEMAATHENALALVADVADEASVAAAFDKAIDAWGRIDAVFNNAGVGHPGTPLDELDVETFRQIMDINVNGSFICAREAFKRMKAQNPQGGRIINNGSVSADVPRWGSAGYTTSKHAVTGLTRSISLDGRPYSILCGQINFGNTMTDMGSKMASGVPQADGSIAVEQVMDVSNAVSSVVHMASLPLEANVQFMTVMPPEMPYIGRG